MIFSVEKIYRDTGGYCFKMTLENGKIWIVPNKEANSDYQSIMEWVENGGVIVDNGA